MKIAGHADEATAAKNYKGIIEKATQTILHLDDGIGKLGNTTKTQSFLQTSELVQLDDI